MMRGIWLGVLVAGVVSLAGCGGIDPTKDCFDEFVQEYVLDVPADEMSNLCPGQNLAGPPAFPMNTLIIRMEYSAGEPYKVQTWRHWVDSSSEGSDCTSVRLEELVTRSRGAPDRRQIVATIDGEVVSEREMGSASMLYHDMKFDRRESPTPKRGRADKSRIESTEFGVDCFSQSASISWRKSMRGTECMPVSPIDSCPAFDKMMPIKAHEDVEGAPVVGRTTIFEYGKVGSVVDKSKWTMPE